MVNKNRVEEYIPDTIKYIDDEFRDYINKNGGLPKELHGYITSFGASIIQSGLIPAVAFYEREKTTGSDKIAERRKKLMRIVAKLQYSDFAEKELLLNRLIQEDEAKKKKSDIIHSAIAIKLAIRLYKQVDGDKNEY